MLNEEIHNLHSSLIISVIKQRRISWAGHVVSMEDIINAQFVGIYERGGRGFEKTKRNHRITLRWILIKHEFIWVRTASSVRLCRHVMNIWVP